MLKLVACTLFLLLTIVGAAVGAAAMIGMPVAVEIHAVLMGLAIGTVLSGIAALILRGPPTFRDRDPIPPYFIGLSGKSKRRTRIS